jgi:hypothetical protein
LSEALSKEKAVPQIPVNRYQFGEKYSSANPKGRVPQQNYPISNTRP